MSRYYSSSTSLDLRSKNGVDNRSRTLPIFILLSLTYVVALRVNGELHRLPTPLMLVLLGLNVYSIKLKISTMLACVCFIALTLMHLIILDATGHIPFFISDVLPDYALYAALVCVYVLLFSDLSWRELERPFVFFFRLIALVALGLWAAAIAAGSTFGVDTSYSTPRLQGLMTEPSNMAHFLPALLIYSWQKKNWLWLGLCAVCVAATFSPTVVLTVLLTAVILKLIESRPLHVLLVLTIVVTVVAATIANFDILLEQLAELGQPGQALARILDGFSFIVSAGDTGANSRADLLFSGVAFMNTYSLWWTGAGFGTSTYIGDAFNGGLLFDANTWFSLVMWFGLFSLPLYLVVQYLAIRKPEDGFSYVLLVTLCVSNTVNAGGVWVQMFFAALLCLKVKHDLTTDLVVASGSYQHGGMSAEARLMRYE